MNVSSQTLGALLLAMAMAGGAGKLLAQQIPDQAPTAPVEADENRPEPGPPSPPPGEPRPQTTPPVNPATPADTPNPPTPPTQNPPTQTPPSDNPPSDTPPASDPPAGDTPPADGAPGNAVEPPPVARPGDDLVPNRPAFLMDVAVNREDRQYTQGERLSIRFKSERDAYVYLLYHQADQSTALIYPNVAQKENLVKAKESVSIPGKGDGFRFRIAAPFGEEALQVIASTKPIELLDKLNGGDARAVVVSGETRQALAELIKQSPDQFAEHRAVIHTYEGGGALPPAREPIRVGLFVGVNKLRDPRFGKEHEQVAGSAKVMHQQLTTVGGIKPENAKLILGEESTRANFEAAVTKWLPSVTQPGDTVFLFYCGHGGQTEAIDDSEPDGLDEFFSVYDSDSKRMRETVVSDDALARWLQELPGRQVVLIMESCHSGGVLDGRGMANAMTDEAGRVRDISQLNTVVITACLSDELSSFSTKIKEATTMPLLFREAMTRLPRPISVQSAYRYYASKVQRGQEPKMVDTALLPIVLVPAPTRPTNVPGGSAAPSPGNAPRPNDAPSARP